MENAVALGRGELQRRVSIPTGDELGQLAEVFNRMAGELQDREAQREEYIARLEQSEEERERMLAELQHGAAELDAVFTSIVNGVIINGPTGEILRMNPAVANILGYSQAETEKPLAERVAMLCPETPDGFDSRRTLPGRYWSPSPDTARRPIGDGPERPDSITTWSNR